MPTVMVQTLYYGNPPIDIENLITRPIEKELESIRGVKKITSNSLQDVSVIFVEFNTGVDINEALQEVRDNVDKAKRNLPNDLLEDPLISDIDFSEFPIININLSGDYSLSELKYYAEFLEDEIERIPEISKVELTGLNEREVKINVDPLKLESFELSFGDIENAIAKFSKAVQIDPNFAFAWDNLGISYRKNEQYDKAIEAYQKSLAIYSEGRLPLLNIAITYNLNKQYQEAIHYYKKFITVYSEDPEGYYGLGLILYTQDQQEEGLDNLIHAYTIYTAQNSPYRADAAKKIGYMYKDLKNQNKLDIFHKVADKYNLKVQNN